MYKKKKNLTEEINNCWYMYSLEELLNELQKQTNLSREDVLKKVDEKYEEFNGMITKEGVVHLVAKELGVKISNENRRQLQIKNIVSGMKNVNVVGRIFRISQLNEFERQDGKKGKVVNIFIADNSGHIRFPLWNDQTKLVEDEKIKIGDVIQISGGWTKENVFGDVEVSLGKFGNIQLSENSFGISDVNELNKKYFSSSQLKNSLENIFPGRFEIKATIVQIFKTNFLFGSEGEQFLVISCSIDDGEGNTRAVLFRDVAEEICGISAKELSEFELENRYELIKERILGKEMIFVGNVRKNKMFDRFEMIVDSVKDINPLEESKKLVEKIETEIGS